MDAPLPIPAPASARWPRAPLGLLGDEPLARMVRGGSERAFAALYERYHQQLYRYCRALLRDDVDAQDALQATFTGAFAALRRGRRDAPVRPWLFRIAHNEAITLLRRRQPHLELSDSDAGGQLSAEEEAIERERMSALVADLNALPQRQRAALVMRELSGLSHEEIALALRTSPGGAKQAIFEARRSLEEFEEGRAMACDEVCRILSDGDRRMLRGRRVSAHIRGCPRCAAFAAAIPERRAELRALAPPLAPALAAGMLGGLLGRAGSAHTGGGAVAGVAGKSAGMAAATKVIVGATIVAGAGVGLSQTLPQSHHSSGSPPHHVRAAPVVGAGGSGGGQLAPGSGREAPGGGRARTDGAHHRVVPAPTTAPGIPGTVAGGKEAHGQGHAGGGLALGRSQGAHHGTPHATHPRPKRTSRTHGRGHAAPRAHKPPASGGGGEKRATPEHPPAHPTPVPQSLREKPAPEQAAEATTP